MITNFLKRFFICLILFKKLLKYFESTDHLLIRINDEFNVFIYQEKVIITEDNKFTTFASIRMKDIFNPYFIRKILSIKGHTLIVRCDFDMNAKTDHNQYIILRELMHNIFYCSITCESLLLLNWNLTRRYFDHWVIFTKKSIFRKKFYKVYKVISEHLGNPYSGVMKKQFILG
jgi:hypothetical protein